MKVNGVPKDSEDGLPNFGTSNKGGPPGFMMSKPLSPIPGQKPARSPQAILKQLTQESWPMTLEEKILNGVFKPEI